MIIAERQAEVEAVYEAIFGEANRKDQPRASSNATVKQSLSLNDSQLLEKARAASNGGRFAALFDRGDWKGEAFRSQSEADLWLCSQFAFWTGCDARRVDLLFRQSGLMRGKWERDDYRGSTIGKAISGCVNTYSGPQPVMIVNGLTHVTDSAEEPQRIAAANGYANGQSSVHAEGEATRPKLGMMTVAEYLKQHREHASRHAWWQGIFYAASFNMLLGRPYTGKSTLIAKLAACLADGMPFLGRECPKANVGYFAVERNGARVAELLEKWGYQDKILFADRAMVPARSAIGFIEEQIKEHGLQVVIIDHLQNIVRIKSEKDYGEVSLALEPFQSMAARTGCCIIALHHQGKTERADAEDTIDAMGSEAYRAAADTLVETTKHKGNITCGRKRALAATYRELGWKSTWRPACGRRSRRTPPTSTLSPRGSSRC